MNHNLDEILYDILKCLASSNAPVIFKGALLTRLIVKDNPYNISRSTRDIDADWNGEKLTISELENYLNIALKQLSGVELKAFRDYDEKISAGFIVYLNHEEIATLDLDMRKNNHYQLYDIDGVKFKGSTVDNILADKIYVISNNYLLRRTKDLIDIYVLSSMVDIDVNKILLILHDKNRMLGDFDALINRKDEVKHAYETLRLINNKPSFDNVYKVAIAIYQLFNKKEA